jgi:hypothetical protein
MSAINLGIGVIARMASKLGPVSTCEPGDGQEDYPFSDSDSDGDGHEADHAAGPDGYGHPTSDDSIKTDLNALITPNRHHCYSSDSDCSTG